MSTGYDIPPPLSSHSQLRKASGNMTASYERTSNTSNRQRTPSPGPSRRAYDSYVPHRAENVPYRNVYRPNNYRPEPSSYHPRSPSPDTRSPESTSYRGSSWRPDRRPLHTSPISRRFEPSDSWRHGHGDRSSRDYPSQSDRHFRGRAGVDLSPERSPRYERMPIGVSDRVAPPYFKRETWPPERRPVMDSYRPHYDDERPPPTRRDHPLSPPGHARRESESSLPSRLTDPDSTRVPMKPSLSLGVLASPSPITHSGPDVPWSSPLLLDALKRVSLPRSASRSSIASTHVSDQRSPGVASIPQPLSTRLPAGLPAKPQAAIDALAKENWRADAKYGVKPVHNSVNSQSPMHAIEPEKVLKSSSTVREPAKDISQNVVEAPQAQARATSVEGGSSIMPAVVDVEAQNDIDDQLPMPILESQFSQLSTKPPTPVNKSPRSPVLRDVTPSDGIVVGSNHSKPGSPLERTPSIRDGDMSALEIPPSTHSPSGSPAPSKETEACHEDLLAHTTLPRPEDIPFLSSARSMREALRVIVMTRLLRDYQSHEARINPILMANLAIAPPSEVHPTSTPGSLIDKMCSGLTHDARLETASQTRPLLVKYFANRQTMIDEKKARLHEEYTVLQDRWIAHCNALNEQQRTLASEQENQPPMRTTRRSMAITDAVRSDFEMEQIIASLGNDDATDPNHLSIRNLAKVPEMISTVNGKVDTVFDDMNYLVDDPAEYYAPDTGINDWTNGEKKIFMEKFGAHPKQFGVIAEFLPNKTAAQCVAYYYLHKKLFIDFRRVISQYAPNKRRRRGMGRKKGNGLLADIAMHDLEVHRGSGSASPSTLIPAPRASRGRRSINPVGTAKPPPPSRRNPVQLEETPTTTPTPEPELKSRKRRAASGTSTPAPINPSPMPIPLLASTPLRVSTPSLSEQYSTSTHSFLQISGLEAAVEEGDTAEQGSRPLKRARRTRRIKSAVTVVDEPVSPLLQTVLLPDEMAESMSHGAGRKEGIGPSTVQWSGEDKKRFLSLLSQYDDDFKQIAALMPPKTIGQVTNYYKTHQAELNSMEPPARVPLPPDNHQPHWSTFPASETKQKISTPPLSSPATLMTTIKPSLAGYDSSRNLYQTPLASSVMPYNSHTNFSEDIQSPSWAPLPTRVSHSQLQSVPSNLTLKPHTLVDPPPETRYNPYNGSRRGSNSSAKVPYPPRNHLSSESSQGYTSSAGKYPEDHSSLLPSPHLASPPNLPSRIPQGYRHPRPRIATSNYHVSPSSHPTSATAMSNATRAATSPTLPGSAAGAAAIIHSPVLPSPQLPLHQSPPYNSYPLAPLPHGGDTTSGVHPREHSTQYRQPGHPHIQSHSRQRSGSSMTGWIQPSSPHAQDRHYQPANISYGNRRSASIPVLDSRGGDERRRETYSPNSNDNNPFRWHPSSMSAQHSSPTWATDSYPQPGWRG